jgi:hypothetical protein
MLENSLSNKGSIGVSDNQLIKVHDDANAMTVIDETL